MTPLSHRMFRGPVFLRVYEKHVHGRFLSSFAKERMSYSTLLSDFCRLGDNEPVQRLPRRVLELGCGTGWFARHLATLERYREAHITGIDLSEGAVAVARDYAARTPALTASLDFATGNAQSLGADVRGPVDEVWLCGCLHQMSAPEAALSEAARVLGPDGRVFCQTFRRNPGLRSDVDIALMRRAGHQVFEPDRLVSMIGSAGLRVVAEELKGIVSVLVLAPGARS